MMYNKALIFGDAHSAQKALEAQTPSEQKRIGRNVSGFDEKTWRILREGVVFTGNYAKFSQNEKLRDALFETGARFLVETAPKDAIWGIGLSEDDPRSRIPSEWKGLNLLGIGLTRVREVLRWELLHSRITASNGL